MPATIYLRADGSKVSGYGHIYRLLALGAMLHDKFRISFVSRSKDAVIDEALRNSGFELIKLAGDPDQPVSADELNFLESPSIIIADGYQFDTAYMDAIKARKHLLVMIDDIQTHTYHADIVINHALGAENIDFSSHRINKLALGASFAILRKPFLEAAKIKRTFTAKRQIFICFGGGLTDDLLLIKIQSIKQASEPLPLHILTGAGSMLHERFRNDEHISTYSNLSAEEIIRIASACTLAITSASTISCEMACIGMPLYILQTVDNQKIIYTGMLEQALALPYTAMEVNRCISAPPEQASLYFSSFVEKQRKVFDGQSGQRLAALIMGYYAEKFT